MMLAGCSAALQTGCTALSVLSEAVITGAYSCLPRGPSAAGTGVKADLAAAGVAGAAQAGSDKSSGMRAA